MRCLSVTMLSFLMSHTACTGKSDSSTSDEPVVGIDARPNNTTCLAPPAPVPAGSVSLQRVFADVTMPGLIALVQPPNVSSHWYAVQQSGSILRFPNDDNVTAGQVDILLDHSASVESGPNEAGLLGLAFHPNFATNGTIYLSYTIPGLRSRLSRMTTTNGGANVDPATEVVLLEVDQPYGNHNGGHIAFGPDGYLYYALGDGGSGGDPENNGQDPTTLLGAVLRLDVDSASPYAIPSDNPFVGSSGADEIFAWGLRNPWRFSFDRSTGDLWAADVGQNEWEEIDVIVNGGNYGWNVREGAHCYNAASCDASGMIDPVWEYPHQNGNASITGGFVYRGNVLEGYEGAYIYGDFSSGRIWALQPNSSGGYMNSEIASSGLLISSFAQDFDGELFVLNWLGEAYRLEPGGPPSNSIPTLLSQTGCVDPTDPTVLDNALIPYDINHSFWSDGLSKQRYLALPNGTQFEVDTNGEWRLPPGGVSMKNFFADGLLLETRFFVRHSNGTTSGYTYQWNGTQTDATLVTTPTTVTAQGNDWLLPASEQCKQCHTAATGRSLGLDSRQLNRERTYEISGRSANQIDTLIHLNMLPSSVKHPPFAPVDGSDSLTARARAYLDVNCASCHQPGGPGRGGLDLRAETPFLQMGICDKVPEAGDLGIANARVVAIGDRTRSVLHARINTRDANAMPPLGSAVVDANGAALIGTWIDAMGAGFTNPTCEDLAASQ